MSEKRKQPEDSTLTEPVAKKRSRNSTSSAWDKKKKDRVYAWFYLYRRNFVGWRHAQIFEAVQKSFYPTEVSNTQINNAMKRAGLVYFPDAGTYQLPFDIGLPWSDTELRPSSSDPPPAPLPSTAPNLTVLAEAAAAAAASSEASATTTTITTTTTTTPTPTPTPTTAATTPVPPPPLPITLTEAAPQDSPSSSSSSSSLLSPSSSSSSHGVMVRAQEEKNLVRSLYDRIAFLLRKLSAYESSDGVPLHYKVAQYEERSVKTLELIRGLYRDKAELTEKVATQQQEYDTKLKAMERKYVCNVCLTAPANCCFVPCGHVAVCQTCSLLVTSNACPLCRLLYTSILELHFQ